MGPTTSRSCTTWLLTVMQKDTAKSSLRGKFNQAGWDESYLAKLIALFRNAIALAGQRSPAFSLSSTVAPGHNSASVNAFNGVDAVFI
jgi:hypothetical protein